MVNGSFEQLNDLRKYLKILDEIGYLIDELPELNYDSEIEDFYNNASEIVDKQMDLIEKRLKDEEEYCIYRIKRKVK